MYLSAHTRTPADFLCCTASSQRMVWREFAQTKSRVLWHHSAGTCAGLPPVEKEQQRTLPACRALLGAKRDGIFLRLIFLRGYYFAQQRPRIFTGGWGGLC